MERGEARFGRLGPELLADPLAFLAAEHARQRALLGHLDRLAGNRTGSRVAIARALAAWFACELPLHLRDEEDSLYPRIARSRIRAMDDLIEANRATAALRSALRMELAHIAAGHRPSHDFAASALEFVDWYRRHLAIEDEQVMPTATRLLRSAQRAGIAREMAARRHWAEEPAGSKPAGRARRPPPVPGRG
jgi:hemerythrin-like domain-containing protein